MVVARGRGPWWNEDLVFNGYRLSIREDRKVLETDVGDDSTTM